MALRPHCGSLAGCAGGARARSCAPFRRSAPRAHAARRRAGLLLLLRARAQTTAASGWAQHRRGV
jgi:hypothetical protein